MRLWGCCRSAQHPEILWALSPDYAWGFSLHNPGITFIILGAVVLCVTGGEALYADMGHFGKRPIRVAWFSIAMPALTLNYFGQGGAAAGAARGGEKPIFLLGTEWAALPLVGLATAAAVIASAGADFRAFRVTKQVIQLGLPRLQVRRPARMTRADLHPLCRLGAVCADRAGSGAVAQLGNLAAAYGIAVTTDMLITTVLTFFVDSLRLEAAINAVHHGHRGVFYGDMCCFQPIC